MMKIMTDKQFKSALARVLQGTNTRIQRDSYIANTMLGEIDRVITNTWSHLGDMGINPKEFARIKRLVKKRL